MRPDLSNALNNDFRVLESWAEDNGYVKAE